LFRVAFTHVNRLIPALLPANDYLCSVVAVEPVMWRKSLGRLPSPQPPLGAACAMEFGHAPILANP